MPEPAPLPLEHIPQAPDEISFSTEPQLRGRLLLGGLAVVLVGTLICAGILLLPLLNPIPSHNVTFILGETATQHTTRAQRVADFLTELSINLGDGDSVSPLPESTITNGMTVWVAQARSVTLTIDDEVIETRTLFTNPLDILKENGLKLSEKDRVWIDGTPTTVSEMLIWPVPATQITVRRAVTIHVEDEGEAQEFLTASETVGEALFESGVTLYLADRVSPDTNTPVTADMTITIQRSSPISIVADGVTLETRAQGQTVADALVSAGVTLMGLDYSIPDETSPLQPGIVIRVIRVTEKVEAVQEAIPYETVFQADASLELDQQAMTQPGQNGIRQRNIRIRYENGVEVSRTEESNSVVVEPVNEVISYGTNVVIRTIDTPEGPREYWRHLRMYATSYHPAALGGDNITATGRVLTKGIVGIDPVIIPYGTQLYVPGYGIGIAADTGGPRGFRKWIDLGYDDSNYVGWHETVDVYLLTPVPAEIDYILPD